MSAPRRRSFAAAAHAAREHARKTGDRVYVWMDANDAWRWGTADMAPARSMEVK